MKVCARWWKLPLVALLAGGCSTGTLRKFPDRPVAWQEHDDENVPVKPEFNGRWENDDVSQGMHDMKRSLDRKLALKTHTPSLDVNAVDEVPCSTWFCPRNHLRPVTVEEIMVGPPGPPAPEPPFTIVKGKPSGVASGFMVRDHRGNQFLLKLDPYGYPSLATGAEVLGPIFMWVAGYNAPAAFLVDLHERDLRIAPGATYKVDGVSTRTLNREHVDEILRRAHRSADGTWRASLSSWVPGEIVGQFNFWGRRDDDPNDRIDHQKRRSLRASKIIFAWLNNYDVKPGQTIDTWIQEDGRRFVKHYYIDWGNGFGANTRGPKLPNNTTEYSFDQNVWFWTLVTLGIPGRSFQGQREAWEREVAAHPSVGWLPSDDWEAKEWRPGRALPVFAMMSDRDAYWGAKVVTSFTDDQIATIVAHGGYSPGEAAYLTRALIVRRDKIRDEYLTRVTAVENPRMIENRLCFEDLAVTRGALETATLAYRIRVQDDHGDELLDVRMKSPGKDVCVPIGRGNRPYRVVTVASLTDGHQTRATYVHLRWRSNERRFVVVGMERDE
jgi:hypothetical protein